MAGQSSCEAIIILIVNSVVGWDFAFNSWNISHQQKMREVSELKMGQQGPLLSIYTQQGWCWRKIKSRGKMPLGPKNRM